MSAAAHTPGPWEIEFDSRGWPQAIIARADMDTLGGVGRVIRMNGIGLPSSPAALANASLITAAPELLGFAKLFARTVEYEIKKSEKSGDDEGVRMKRLTLNLINAAIAKAEGAP